MIPRIPTYILTAINELGTKEIDGSQDNPRILQYLETVNLEKKHDEIPWCSAFVNWVMTIEGYNGTNKANARSWLGYGKEIKEPILGAIVVFKSGRQAWQGHVAFILDSSNKYVKVVGGNQSDKVGIANYSRKNVLGYRLPIITEKDLKGMED